MSAGEKKKTGILYKIVIIALLCVIAFSLFKIGSILLEYHRGTKEYERLQEIAETEDDDFKRINFKELKKENPDVIAWLYAEDTVINYPVVQGEDNEYYLYRTVSGEWNGKGSIFADYRCAKPFSDFNTILYGHRMKDGSMFYSLTKYEEQSYYEKHPVMRLFTPKKTYDLEIFAAVRIPSDSSLYRCDFQGEKEKAAYLKEVGEKSLIDTGVKVTPKERIVMLSTCTYEFENARLVVYGKLVENQ